MRLLAERPLLVDRFPTATLSDAALARLLASPTAPERRIKAEGMPFSPDVLINVGLASSRIEGLGAEKGLYRPDQSSSLTINTIYTDGKFYTISNTVIRNPKGEMVSATVALSEEHTDGEPATPLGKATIAYGKYDKPREVTLVDGSGEPITEVSEQKRLAVKMSTVASELNVAFLNIPSESVYKAPERTDGYVDVFKPEEDPLGREQVLETSIDQPTLTHIQKASAMIKRVGIEEGAFGKGDVTTISIDHLPRGKKSYQLSGTFSQNSNGRIGSVEITVSEEKGEDTVRLGKVRLEYSSGTMGMPEKLFVEDPEGNALTDPKDTRRIATLIENVASKIDHYTLD